jgi:hypothetical protein
LLSESERRIKILDYVRQNSLDNESKLTKSDVMRHMKDARMMTTHKTTIELIKEGKIKMVKPKDKPYSQTDYLVINEENEFNKIYNSFSEIEKIIKKLMDVGPKTLPVDILVRLVSTYIVSTKALVDCLLIRINTKNHSEKDAFILNKKAINLMGKIDTLPYYSHNWTDEINSRIRFVEHAKLSLKEEFEQVPPDVNEWFDYIIDELNKFKKKFLSETKQKTKKP